MLPKGSRPSHYLYIKVYTYGSTVEITPAGLMYAYSPNSATAREYTSLAGLSFPLGS